MRGRLRLALPDWLRARFTDAQRFLLLCAVAGLLCGLTAVAFHVAIDGLFHGLWRFASQLEEPWLTITMIVVPTLGALATGVVLWKMAPNASGSGIPQTKVAFFNEFGVIPLKDGLWRFILGVLYVGTGNSLGREGPTVHVCSAIASRLGQISGLAKARIQAMVPVGFGAGIAAAFNTPFSAIFFVFEELLDDFSTKALMGIVFAVAIAVSVTRILLGSAPVLPAELSNAVFEGWMLPIWVAAAIPMGLAAGLLGHAFVRSVLVLRAQMQASRVPVWLRPVSGGLTVGCVGMACFYFSAHYGDAQLGVFSIGYKTLEAAFHGELLALVMLVMFGGKFVCVVICYASGGSGGLFSPTLFLGGMFGGIFGVGLFTVLNFFDFAPADQTQVAGACVLLGMGAMFASIVRCPITSFFIISEMTGNWRIDLPLVVGNVIAFLLAARLQRVSLYNALILQDGINLRKMPSYQGAQDYRNLPVSTIMTYEALMISGDQNARENLAALKKLGRKHHGYPVVDKENRLVGVITHHELDEHVEHGLEASLAELLQRQRIVSITPDTSIRSAAATMIKEDVLQVPVVGEKDPSKLIGILTLHDIARQQNTVTEQLGR